MNIQSRVVIRQLEGADVSPILKIIGDCRQEYGLQGRVHSILEPSDYAILDTYRQERSHYCVAVIDGEIVGGGGIAPLAGDNPLVCELQRMYLHPTSRAQGIGQAVLTACIQAATRFQFERCYAETISEMTTAIAFYKRHGFRALTAPLGSTGHGHNDCWMVLDMVLSGF